LNAVEEIKFKDKHILIYIDPDPQSPRDDDNLGTILYTSYRYTLGDKRVDINEIEDITKSKALWLPVYAYIHSGIVLNTTGFSCRWDSGQCGIIYTDRDKVLSWFRRKKMSAELKAQVMQILNFEVEEFSSYVSGECYGWQIFGGDGSPEDSCGGYYDFDYCKSEALAQAV